MLRRQMMRTTLVVALGMGVVTPAASQAPRDPVQLPAGAEAWSLSGTPLTPPEVSASALAGLEANLAKATACLLYTSPSPRD